MIWSYDKRFMMKINIINRLYIDPRTKTDSINAPRRHLKRWSYTIISISELLVGWLTDRTDVITSVREQMMHRDLMQGFFLTENHNGLKGFIC